MEESGFRCRYRVLYGDTDAAAVVYNANYLRFFEIGRTEFMREKVCSYREIEKLGIILPVTECHVRYKAFARYDDLLIFETSLVELKKVSCKFAYKIFRENKEQGREQLVAKGWTIHASVNKQDKLTPIPAALIPALQNLLPQTP